MLEKDAEARAEGQEDTLALVSKYAAEVEELDETEAMLLAKVETIGARRTKLLEDDIPKLMEQVGLASFKLENGAEVVVDEPIYASISKKNQGDAYQWLRDNDHEDLIKNEIKVALGKGEDELAKLVMKYLVSKKIDFTQKESVHAGSLKAFVRTLLEEEAQPGYTAEKLPQDLFGVYRPKIAKIQKPKVKKGGTHKTKKGE